MARIAPLFGITPRMDQLSREPRWMMSSNLGIEPEPGRRFNKPRRWREKFHEAFRGMKRGMRGHSSFSVHFFFAALVIAIAGVLNCDWIEWCLLLGCIGLVFTAELFNSAIETIFHGLDPESKQRIQGSLDIAAGAVLMSSITAATIGGVIFGRHFFRIF